jgi:hypothetical protein
MRSNIDIDDELMERALRLSGLTTKKEVVHRALAEFVHNLARKDLADLEGKIQLTPEYDYKQLRGGRELDHGRYIRADRVSEGE